MITMFSRTALLIGDDAIDDLHNKHVAVFGVGGVGGNCIESLVRTGIGEITIVDNDVVTLTNLNRQIIALHSTIGKKKVDVMKERLLDINPDVIVHTLDEFINEESLVKIDFSVFDYVVDAIDTTFAKILLIEECYNKKIPIISCMGTGNRLSSDTMKITTIEKTAYCSLARVVRRELKDRNIKNIKVLSSSLKPIKPRKSEEITLKREVPGSVSFVPNVAGLLISNEIIKDFTNM